MARSSVNFPALTPSSRSFSPGEYPQTVFEAQNGAKTIIRYGNRQVNAKLTLSFTNITDIEAYSIVENYKNVNKDWDYIIFSEAQGLKGIEDIHFRSAIQFAGSTNARGTDRCRWRYAGPPQYSSVSPGRANVSCSFVACLDGD